MNWKFTGDRPVYQQIMLSIQGAVLTGEFSPGDKFPSVRDLATAAKVNPNTMQHALQELEREGLLITHGTSGRHVTEDEAVIAAIRERTLRELTGEVIAKYAALGISPAQAARMIEDYPKERDEM